MRLTLHADFALRVLIQVELNEKLTTIKEIAQTFDISKAHLMKVVNALSSAAKLLTRDEARRIAVNFATLPDLGREGPLRRG